MSKIKISEDFTLVKIEDATFKRTSLRGAIKYTVRSLDEKATTIFIPCIIVSLHNHKFKVVYKNEAERDEDLKKLGNLMEGKLKMVDL